MLFELKIDVCGAADDARCLAAVLRSEIVIHPRTHVTEFQNRRNSKSFANVTVFRLKAWRRSVH